MQQLDENELRKVLQTKARQKYKQSSFRRNRLRHRGGRRIFWGISQRDDLRPNTVIEQWFRQLILGDRYMEGYQPMKKSRIEPMTQGVPYTGPQGPGNPLQDPAHEEQKYEDSQAAEVEETEGFPYTLFTNDQACKDYYYGITSKYNFNSSQTLSYVNFLRKIEEGPGRMTEALKGFYNEVFWARTLQQAKDFFHKDNKPYFNSSTKRLGPADFEWPFPNLVYFCANVSASSGTESIAYQVYPKILGLINDIPQITLRDGRRTVILNMIDLAALVRGYGLVKKRDDIVDKARKLYKYAMFEYAVETHTNLQQHLTAGGWDSQDIEAILQYIASDEKRISNSRIVDEYKGNFGRQSLRFDVPDQESAKERALTFVTLKNLKRMFPKNLEIITSDNQQGTKDDL